MKKKAYIFFRTYVVAWVDRNFNLLFNHQHCVKLELNTELTYNTMLYNGQCTYRHLGRKWFILVKQDQPKNQKPDNYADPNLNRGVS